MSNAVTDPMPLDSSPEGPRRTDRPLGWLRKRLFPERRPTAAPSTLPAFPASTGRGHALRKAHAALQLTFAAQPGLAQVFPHLGLLEKALARQGSQALRRLPSVLLQRALEQLNELELRSEDADLPVLRNRLIEELALRSVRADAQRTAAHEATTVAPSAGQAGAEAVDTDLHWMPPAPSSRRH